MQKSAQPATQMLSVNCLYQSNAKKRKGEFERCGCLLFWLHANGLCLASAASREAAEECSPRRKPWGKAKARRPSPEGAKETSVKDKLWPVENIDYSNPLGNRDAIFLRPSGASSLFLVASHGLRRGLHSFAPSELGPLPYSEPGCWRGRSSDSRF